MLRTLGWDVTKLKRCTSSLVGFSGERVYPEGRIKLPLTLGDGKEAFTQVEEFVVIDGPLAYNTILGRLTIHHFKAVPSTYHKTMKFPISNGTGTVDR